MDDAKSKAEKAKALAAALSQIEKQFGKGSVMKLSDADVAEDIQVVSTGSLGLDIALGVGGLPRGRVVEIYGPESSGKTTLTLQVIAEMQKLGGTCAFIDAEHALDVQYASKLGVHLEARLKTMATDRVEEVRVRGLWAGVQLKVSAGPARPYCYALRERGMLCKDTHVQTIRLAPPLVITREQIDWAVDQLEAVLG